MLQAEKTGTLAATNCTSTRFSDFAPSYDDNKLLRFVRRASSLGLKGVQIGLPTHFGPIEVHSRKKLPDRMRIERSVHIGRHLRHGEARVDTGGMQQVARESHDGTTPCKKLSIVASVHPSFLWARSV